jgi:YVTN family beta-propeller protein
VVNIAEDKVIRSIAVPAEPTGIALSRDGGTVYVTCAAPNSAICAVNVETGKVETLLTAGHTATAPVVAPDGKRLYVCNRFDDNVAVLDLPSRNVIAKVGVTREPIAAAVTPDGRFLFVANHLPAGPANQGYTAAVVSVIDTTAANVVTNIPLPNGSTGLRGVCISPDGRHAYVTHTLARYQLPTTQLERGWMNTNALSVIDVAKKELVNTVLLDNVDRGAANPWGVACTADGKYICVTHAGTHELSVIDRGRLHEKLAKAKRGELMASYATTPVDIQNDLAFLVDLRRRIELPGKGPRGLAVMGTKAYATEYFSDTLAVVDINPDVRPRPSSIALGPEKPLTKVRKGHMFFNDAFLCFQQWQSCASCHPDARADALNWDLLNDGLGNPKNVLSLLLTHQTPPAMATGIREDANSAVRAGIRHIQFAVRPEEDAKAIDEYLKSLQPVASPHLVNGEPGTEAKRGKEVFFSERIGCARCHQPPLYTDLKLYDVGTHGELDYTTDQDGKRVPQESFDTPTLIEVWRTAPYLHDGRYSTIEELLRKGKHGLQEKELTEQELSDLIAFVLSL